MADARQTTAGIPVQKFTGRGGDVLVEQLRHCGIEYFFANPSGHMGPVFDALVDRPDTHVILGLQEGLLLAMADGFAKVSGRTPFVLVSRPGFPNAVVHLFNAFRDRTPLVVAAEQLNESSRGQFSIQEVDDLLQSAKPFTRWRWESRRADSLAEDVRRAFKFASTPPGGPVFLSLPQDFMAEPDVRAEIIDQQYFALTDAVHPSTEDVEAVAERLVAAESPLLYVGPEVHRDGAESAVVSLAEMLSIPVVEEPYGWSNAFPTDHPLYLGSYQQGARYPATVDFLLNVGGKNPPLPQGAQQAHVSMDVDSLGRVNPAVLTAMSNTRSFTEALRQAVGARLTESRMRTLREQRGDTTRSFTQRMAQARRQIARSKWAERPISHERIGMELEQALEPRTCIVQLLDSGRIILNYLTFSPKGKAYISTNGQALGWSLGAALGAKLAQPDRPVVALMGDGDFLFGGSQGLWTAQRYRIPITVVILNNRSYDNERNRIWARESRQAERQRDMTSYIGSPNVEFTRLAQAYGITAEKVEDPDDLAAALRRAVDTNRNGAPCLLDVIVSRRGLGAESTWYPAWSLAAERTRRI